MKFKMEDGRLADTDRASKSWNEATDFDGSNHRGRHTGSQWHDATLYRSKKGHFYLATYSRVQGQRDTAEWVSNEEAAKWLIYNDHELPEDLKKLEAVIVE